MGTAGGRLIWFLAHSAPAAPDPDESSEPGLPRNIAAIEELSLEALLGREVAVATRSDQEVREAPGLVSVLTAEDLRRAGCRDLEDALRLLAAIEVGTDTWGAVGIGVRGNWGFESKVLFRIDGHDWNELDYGTFTLGNRLPAEAIERIEVIRGPGSAVYGGYASLAVVQITTRASSDTLGTRIDARGSWLDSGRYGAQNLSASGGYLVGADGRLGLTAVVGRGRRTDGIYRSVRGNEVDLADASALDPALLSADLRLGGFSLAAMAERYHNTQRTGFGGGYRFDRDSDFRGVHARASWELDLGERWSVTPRASFQWQSPWWSVRNVPEAWVSRNRTDRTVFGADVRGTPVAPVELSVGGEGGLDQLHVPQEQRHYWIDGRPHARYGFGGAWAQGVLKTAPINVIAGVRLDAHTAYGQAVSPRIGLTRAWDRAHAKIQVSRAFRAPGFQQSLYAVRPERSTTLEAELGVEPVPWAYLTGSLFEVRMVDAIVYQVTDDPELGRVEGYANVGGTGSRGGELELQIRADPLSVSVAYSGYTGAGLTEGATDRYRVPGVGAAHLGLPNHKAVVQGSVDLPANLWAGSVLTLLGPRWAITAVDDGAPVYEALPAAAVVGLSGGVRLLDEVLWVTVHAHDLLDAAPPYPQPYDGMHGPLPSTGREVGLQLTLSR